MFGDLFQNAIGGIVNRKWWEIQLAICSVVGK